ncbi:SCO7613 C-terminal domain-containing membrane protein [Geodermatophilus maliterrae]|uniref:SCO7613 C-terminal domain-containing membrane protein n=1 Tax=Geodermatophilus maliterrae TaxID=3162531 RepID=A0ABV3XC35_9ACTN
MTSTDARWGLPCPVCGTPAAPAPAPCPTCGLPAVGQAATVVARLGATIEEFARERDALVATLRAAVPGRVVTAAGRASTPPAAARAPFPPAAPPPVAPPPVAPPPPPPLAPLPAPRRRISPQQVLLGLGALLVVAAALAFVAVAWTRLGVTFQAAVMATVTATAMATSAWTARHGLRATEEALAAAGAALLAVDLGAAHARGLWSVDAVPERLWAGLSCATVALVALGLGRLTRSTVTWPVVALLAAQPVGLLLLPEPAAGQAAGAAVALGTALADVLVVLVLRPSLHRPALALAGLWTAVGALRGVGVAWELGPVQSWTATAVLVTAGAVTVPLLRELRLTSDLRRVAAGAAGLPALALSGSLAGAGSAGTEVAGSVTGAGLGLVLLTAAVPVRSAPAVLAGLLSGGLTLAGAGTAVLAAAGHTDLLALLLLAAAVPATLAALLRPEVRLAATGTALALPGLAVLLATEAGLLVPAVAGLLLALLAAVAFGVAALRARWPEEAAAAAVGAGGGLLAGAVAGTAGAWGQVGIDLAVAGAAAGVYAVVARRRPVAVLAVADLVVAGWIAAAGADVRTPEVYSLPAAAGLLLLALPALRARAGSWAAEGGAVAVALAPSAMVVVTDPTALRLVLVVAAATLLTVAGTLTHRQAPFVVGAATLAFVVLGRLSSYAPLVPRWVTLATAGLLLLVVGATYERRRQQAREAVAWVAQMR